MKISLIAAIAENGCIGNENQLLWRISEDMQYFKRLTMGHCVLMGRKTYQSIPSKFKPLEGRTNIILSTDTDYSENGCSVFNTLSSAIEYAKHQKEKELFIIGGAQIYEQTIELAETLYITRVHEFFNGDAYFPSISFDEWELISSSIQKEEHILNYTFDTYKRKKSNP